MVVKLASRLMSLDKFTSLEGKNEDSHIESFVVDSSRLVQTRIDSRV